MAAAPSPVCSSLPGAPGRRLQGGETCISLTWLCPGNFSRRWGVLLVLSSCASSRSPFSLMFCASLGKFLLDPHEPTNLYLPRKVFLHGVQPVGKEQPVSRWGHIPYSSLLLPPIIFPECQETRLLPPPAVLGRRH